MDLTTFNAAMKEFYIQKGEEIQFRDRPLLAYLTKVKKFGGRRIPIPVQYADPQNVSSDFTTTLNRASNGTTQVVEFDLTRTKLYNMITLDRELLKAATGGDASFWEAQTTEISNAIEAVSNRLNQLLYRAGWGEIGTVTAVAGSTITVSPTNSYNFQPKMYVGFSATLASSVLRGTGGAGAQFLQVQGVNNQTGVVTFTTTVASVTGGGGVVTVADTAFTMGDRQDSASPVKLVVAGLEGWAPQGGPSAVSWFGVDRTVDSKLGGVSYDGTADAPEDAILELSARMGEIGQKPTHAFVSFRQFNKIVKNQRIYERFRDQLTATVGFDAIKIAGAGSMVTVVADKDCPNDRVFCLNRDAVKLFSAGEAVQIIDEDGNTLVRSPSADSFQMRIGFLGNMAAVNPAAVGNGKLTAV